MQVGENLVRHRSGTIYLRAKVEGKVIRFTLETTNLRIAKLKRDDVLAGIRAAAEAQKASSKVRTIGDTIAVISTRLLSQPQLDPKTITFYQDMINVLNLTLPVAIHGKIWTAGEAALWWKAIAKRYSPSRANNVLRVAKLVGKALIEFGLRLDDPTAKLKRMKILETVMHIPSREVIESIVVSIRSQGKAHSEEAANFVAFLAFAGCRVGQARAFHWEHVEKDWIKFPSGVSGTKGAKTRRLPISPRLRTVLEAMRPTNVAYPTGPIFKVKNPRFSLDSACARVGQSHLRIHDLRHFFATYALECGVDVPTVSKWLGHKDGGVLVLKTYAHLRDEHGLASAAKLIA